MKIRASKIFFRFLLHFIADCDISIAYCNVPSTNGRTIAAKRNVVSLESSLPTVHFFTFSLFSLFTNHWSL
jgi:hypothetical protein